MFQTLAKAPPVYGPGVLPSRLQRWMLLLRSRVLVLSWYASGQDLGPPACHLPARPHRRSHSRLSRALAVASLSLLLYGSHP